MILALSKSVQVAIAIYHIKNIFTEGELIPNSTVAKFAIVQDEGNRQVGQY